MLYLTTAVMPASGSTSTSQIWQPLGKVLGGLGNTRLASRLAGTSSHKSMPFRSFLGQLHDADAAVGAGDGEERQISRNSSKPFAIAAERLQTQIRCGVRVRPVNDVP